MDITNALFSIPLNGNDSSQFIFMWNGYNSPFISFHKSIWISYLSSMYQSLENLQIFQRRDWPSTLLIMSSYWVQRRELDNSPTRAGHPADTQVATCWATFTENVQVRKWNSWAWPGYGVSLFHSMGKDWLWSSLLQQLKRRPRDWWNSSSTCILNAIHLKGYKKGHFLSVGPQQGGWPASPPTSHLGYPSFWPLWSILPFELQLSATIYSPTGA